MDTNEATPRGFHRARLRALQAMVAAIVLTGNTGCVQQLGQIAQTAMPLIQNLAGRGGSSLNSGGNDLPSSNFQPQTNPNSGLYGLNGQPCQDSACAQAALARQRVNEPGNGTDTTRDRVDPDAAAAELRAAQSELSDARRALATAQEELRSVEARVGANSQFAALPEEVEAAKEKVKDAEAAVEAAERKVEAAQAKVDAANSPS